MVNNITADKVSYSPCSHIHLFMISRYYQLQEYQKYMHLFQFAIIK